MYKAFAGTIGVVSAWAIWGGDMFPQQPVPKTASKLVEPKGGEHTRNGAHLKFALCIDLYSA